MEHGCLAIANRLNSLKYHRDLYKLFYDLGNSKRQVIVLYPRSGLWFSMCSLYFYHQCIDCLALIIFPSAQEIHPPNWILSFPLLG